MRASVCLSSSVNKGVECMSVGDWLAWLWSLFTDNGYHVFDVFISFADILIFVIFTGLFVWFISVLLGGD